MSNRLLQGSLSKNIILYTIPIILSGVLQLLFNAADLVVVGQFCGGISVAAVGATGSITHLFVNLFTGLSIGAGVLVARSYGANDRDTIRRTVHTAVPTSVILGLILALLGQLFAEKFLTIMGTPENVLPLSTLYMKIYFAGMPFSMLFNYNASILRAAGDTKRPLYHLTVAGVLNVILNVVFVTLFHMNVAGVALATVISQALSACLTTKSLTLREDASRLSIRQIKIYPGVLWKMTVIGLPAGIQGALFSISNIVIQSSINSFGDAVMAGSSASSNIEGFTYTVMNSFSQATVNFVGQNAGAGDIKRVKKSFGLCVLYVSVAGLALGSLSTFFAKPLLSIYLKGNMEQILPGVVRMTYVCLPYFLCGIHEVITGALRGLGASVSPMVIAVVGICGFRLAWIATYFSHHHTLGALFVSYPISWIITSVIELVALLFILSGLKKKAGAQA